MNCKHCGSPDIRRFEVIYDEGKSEEKFTAQSTPKWNTKPFTPLGKQTIKGHRTALTNLAKRCAPPSNPEDVIFYLSAFPAIIVGFYSSFKIGFIFNSFWIGFFSFFIVLFGCIFGCYYLWKHLLGGKTKLESHRENLRRWHHSWFCLKCGGVSTM